MTIINNFVDMGVMKGRAGARPVFKFASAMLIDDSDIDNFINQKILEGNFFAERIYVNTGGVSALEFLKNLAVNEELIDQLAPEVIFIDLNMPIMDGFQFIEQYQKLSEKIKSRTRLIILTSSFNPEDRLKAKTRYNDILFLNKPLTDESLALIS